MKIVKNTPSLLLLEDRPITLSIGVWLIAVILLTSALGRAIDGGGATGLVTTLGLGTGAIAWYFFPFQRITFDRATGEMHRRVARITGARSSVLSFTNIKSAAGQGNWAEGTRMERIVLLTDDDAYPLEFGFSGTSRKEQVDAINAWLAAARG